MQSGRGEDAGMRPTRLQVRLLGTVEVILDGQRLRAFDSLRLQRFLALVSLQSAPQQRSRLAFELWPDSTEAQARTNLRKLLHEFRNSMPDAESFVEIGKATVRWLTGGPSDVDVLRFRDGLAAGDFELAARVYAGDLLPASYDDWVLEERAKLHTEALDALARLADEAAQREDFKGVMRHTQRTMELEPTDESAVLLHMQACLALDDKASALRSYHRYAEVLERDLGFAPGGEIEDLYQNLRTGSAGRDGHLREQLAPVTESSFIGREAEWQRLADLWRESQQGRAQLVLIAGEPGVGKSRLAAEFRRSVQRNGYPVACARAYEAAGRLPWGPVVDLLRSRELAKDLAGLDDAWRTELARLLPELAPQGQSTVAGEYTDPVQRHRLFDAVRQVIAGGERPRLFIIDDLQWCDAETIELIGFVIRSQSTTPVLFVGTVRPEEVVEDHALTVLTEALTRDRALTEMPLARLDQAATAALAARLRPDGPLDRELEARLWKETEGNPLFVIETLRAGINADSSMAIVTPTIRAVLAARLEQLPAEARQLADAAGVFGRPFSANVMAAMTGIDEAELVDYLDELWRRRIITEHGPDYDFSHDKLRAVALETISPVRRRRLHRAAAEAITAELQENADVASAQLAAHYDQAGMIEQAIDAYRVAGSRAVAVSALEEAVSMFQRALELLAEMPASSERDSLELDIRVSLGSPLVAREGYGADRSHRLYERARSLCRKLRRPVDPPILRGLGLARLQGCRFDDCETLAQMLLDDESRDPVTRTEGQYLLGVSAFWRGDLATSRQYLESAIETYEDAQGDTHLALYAQDPKAVCLARLAWAELWAGELEEADARARAALAFADDLDHVMTTAYVTTYAAFIAAESADAARLSELLEAAEQLWRRFSERYLNVVLDALRGWLEVSEGSAASVDKILECATRSRAEGETLHLTYILLLLARARQELGEFQDGRAATREAIEWTRKTNQRYLEAELMRVDGELAYHCGDSDAARARLQGAMTVAQAQGAGWLEERARQSLAARFPDLVVPG